jgi:hypothetical protein
MSRKEGSYQGGKEGRKLLRKERKEAIMKGRTISTKKNINEGRGVVPNSCPRRKRDSHTADSPILGI